MRSTWDRIRHAISFELGGLALISPLGAWAFGMPVADVGVVGVACAIIATVWTYFYNPRRSLRRAKRIESGDYRMAKAS